MWSDYPEVESELEHLERYISESIRSRNRLLTEIAADLTSAGGKRLRPAFVILSAQFGEYSREKIFPAAGAIEILHTATLVHDDIVDKADVRRGLPTVSQRFGNDMAVYTGDFLFTKAILMLSGNMPVEQLETVAKAVKVICEGEVDQFLDRFNIDISVPAYLKKTSRKTAVLFAIACSVGAHLGGCTHEVVGLLARYGMNYGMAFQIRDDLNDFTSDIGKSGKPVGNDIMKGIITLPAIFALRKSTALRDKLKNLISPESELTSEDTGALVDAVKVCGGLEASEGLLKKFVSRGIKQLDKLPDVKSKEILSRLIKDLADFS